MPVATRRRIITSPLVTRTDVADYEAGLRTVLIEVGLVGTATVTHYGDAVGAESLIEIDGNPRLVTTFRPDPYVGDVWGRARPHHATDRRRFG